MEGGGGRDGIGWDGISFEGVCLVDTTVILAQPRGSRLRADAVYVHRSGSGRRTVDRGFYITIFSRGPPFFAPDRAVPRCSLGKQKAKKRPMARSILATKV